MGTFLSTQKSRLFFECFLDLKLAPPKKGGVKKTWFYPPLKKLWVFSWFIPYIRNKFSLNPWLNKQVNSGKCSVRTEDLQHLSKFFALQLIDFLVKSLMTPSAPSDSQCFLPSKIGYQGGGLSLKIFLGNPNPILLEMCCFHDFMSLPTKKLQYKNAAVNDLESLFGMQSEASNEGLSWTDCSLSRTLHFWKKPKEFCLISPNERVIGAKLSPNTTILNH